MAESDKYLLPWEDREYEIPLNFSESLGRNEFFDVSLTTDGCLFGAYRSDLLAPSPHLQQSGDNIWPIETNIEKSYPDDGGKIDCMEDLFREHFENIDDEGNILMTRLS